MWHAGRAAAGQASPVRLAPRRGRHPPSSSRWEVQALLEGYALTPLGGFRARDAGLLWACKRALSNDPFELLRHQLAISRSTATWSDLA
eukprot:scaffold45952_cov93-Phaeocystis_antarctica.AAC.1